MRRLIGVVGIGLLALVLGVTADAGADCAGPSIRVEPTVGPTGSSATITGEAWGDNCYDTGPPPPGEGVLGVPVAEIELSFTDAAGTRTLLATVDADTDYGFVVEFTVPPDAAAGAATILAAVRRSDQTPAQTAVFTVGDQSLVPAAPPFTG